MCGLDALRVKITFKGKKKTFKAIQLKGYIHQASKRIEIFLWTVSDDIFSQISELGFEKDFDGFYAYRLFLNEAKNIKWEEPILKWTDDTGKRFEVMLSPPKWQGEATPHLDGKLIERFYENL
ncbi:MAG: hypothetical protein PHF35_00660 [Candidatus Moranbacteria bacterium]|nr:hypothetical protein [Candidatus Moranbacteria bacterium]